MDLVCASFSFIRTKYVYLVNNLENIFFFDLLFCIQILLSICTYTIEGKKMLILFSQCMDVIVAG
jgi:hypothetical protein